MFQHLTTRVSEVGLAQLDTAIMEDFRPTEEPSDNILRYLERFTSEISLRSNRGRLTILHTLRDNVPVDTGAPLEGVDVLVSERDQSAYGTDRFALDVARSPRFSDTAVQELKEIYRVLAEARGPSY